MNEIWANRLIAGTKTWTELPVSRKKSVKTILANRVKNGIITAEQYFEITNEKYEA